MIQDTFLRRASVAAVAAALAVWPTMACAQAQDEQAYQLPAQDLSQALREVGTRTGRNLVVPAELVAGRKSPPLSGRYTPEAAVEALLTGSGLALRRVDGSLVVTGGTETTGRAQFEAEEDSGIVVTETPIRGTAPAGASVIGIDRESLERSGYATTQQILQALPQNFGGGPGESTSGVTTRNNASLNTARGSGINLRGLGSSSTLILLNGNRPPLGGFSGIFTDVSLIPVTAIERIEVLTDGASALYGSDAVAGVVNIIPRTRFEGFEVSLRAGTADGDFGEMQAGLIGGTRFGSGRLVLGYEYHERGRLPASQRDFATDDLRRFGGPDYRAAYASPGTILAGGRSFAIPPGQSGVGLRPQQLLADQVNLGDGWTNTDLLPKQQRHAIYARAEQDLGRAFSAYAEALVADRKFELRPRPTSLAPRIVPVTNPFYVDPIGTGEPVRVQYDFREDLGAETQTGRVQAVGLSAGAQASIGRWRLDLHGTYGSQRERVTLGNIVNSARLARALADSNPATAYNLFGDGPSTNASTIDAIRGSSSAFDRYRMWSGTARADGPLLRLPAGDLRMAIGGEHREENFESRSVSDRSTLEPFDFVSDLPGTRRILAAYAELLVPLFGGANRMKGFERLDVSLAGRVEHYSDFGTTRNPKLGVSWTPIEGATLRGTYGTSFRAPSFADLQQGPDVSLYFVFPLPDPASPRGATNALVLRGNDPDIGPERATTWTAGLDLSPGFAPGLRLSATWFNIRYRDRIVDPAAELFNILTNRAVYAPLIDPAAPPATVAAYYASPFFIDFLGIPASAVSTIIDLRNQNLAVVTQSGIDFDLGYRRAVLGGTVDLGLSGTRLAKLRQALTISAPAADILGTLGNPPDLKLRARAIWSRGAFGIAAFVNHIGGYENRTTAVAEPVDAWSAVDLQLSADLTGPRRPRGLKLALNVSNLFDRDPPYVNNFNGLSAVGYDPENASPVGRLIAFQVTSKW